MAQEMAESANRRLDAEEKVVKDMEYGKTVYYADDWINGLVFSGTKKEIERKLKKIFLGRWVW
jgi:hypothetical protein